MSWEVIAESKSPPPAPAHIAARCREYMERIDNIVSQYRAIRESLARVAECENGLIHFDFHRVETFLNVIRFPDNGHIGATEAEIIDQLDINSTDW